MKKKQTKNLIHLDIVDDTGHSEFDITVDEAIPRMVEQAQKFGKWLFLGADKEPYFMQHFDEPSIEALRAALDGIEEVMIGPPAMGGAGVRVRGRITKLPVSQELNDRNRAQIAICFNRKDGQTQIKIIGSDYNGALGKLRPYRDVIVAGLVRVLAGPQTD